MIKQARSKFTLDFKAEVFNLGAKNRHTLAQLLQKLEVSVVAISRLKTDFLENYPLL